ncbi:hypothetical protein NOGI109294_21500 [Nocardiopsis gilva]
MQNQSNSTLTVPPGLSRRVTLDIIRRVALDWTVNDSLVCEFRENCGYESWFIASLGWGWPSE